MKGYKAFEKGMVCRGKQYAENTVFEEETVEICKSGMHFCKNLLDVLDYYPLIDNNGNMTEFAEVEALDDCETDDNKKFCTKKLKVGAKLSLPQFIKASVEVTYENIKAKVEEETKQIKNKGDNAQLVGGNGAQLVGGYGAQLVGGNDAQLVGGENSIIVGDNGSIAKGNKGTVIMLIERDGFYKIVGFKAVQIDGAKIKEDTFYELVDGEFVEVDENG